MRIVPLIAGVAALSASALMADSAQDRLKDSAQVFSEVMKISDKAIPQDLLSKAQCAVIVPGLKKGAFIVGGEYGRGFAMCRKPNGRGWGPPAALRVEGGSFGFQIGGSSTDVIMLVMNQDGMNRLSSDKFTLGADASVAAGPVGRTAAAQTDLELRAEILTWSRSRGVFAGISLKGAVVQPDHKVDEELYGPQAKSMTTRDIVTGNFQTPDGAHQLVTELDRYSLRKEGSGTASRSDR
ncbi:MAG: lipid-binding SYLF domain-containing protein [Acidobacteriia bacterium]|nr:lipid-binding SYLF domain-containing protein [Terriglobia bacterium]